MNKVKKDLLILMDETIKREASDLHITVGVPPMIRVNGKLEYLSDDVYSVEDTQNMVMSIMNEEQFNTLKEKGQIDYSYSNTGKGRFRINAYKQRGSYSIACRLVNFQIPSLEELHLPGVTREFTKFGKGLVLVTGSSGSGKTTTIASLVDIINHERNSHIITLEDPIEYLHRHDKSMVNQREIGNDTTDYPSGLLAALRQDPDIIVIGEIHDVETLSLALKAAETGHLVISSMHIVGAVKTIERIIDIFPPHQQQQARVQLSTVLRGIISQQLIPSQDQNGRIPAVEILLSNTAIRNLIRENKMDQINGAIQMNGKLGMTTMDAYLIDLLNRGKISKENTLFYSMDQENMKNKFIW
ncbi:type IV pilus twitching motility protein PilT [Alkalibaculum bacchi]|uniref:type IV pilus twitching motility protein PilT n=1 Tax=Alkalibaculum bacchi TaxID=645887 RepID=UPI0026F1C7CD|nr:PilT/PilU family type 4a pilus ATPase [Alkalibaculum bacchi]